MANTKITELTALTQCAATDVLPIVKVSANTTKKVSISDLLRNAPAGTAGAPSIANADDQDTGIFFPAANSVGVSTGGTQRLVIDSSGKVGVGTASPGAGLDVVGNSTMLRLYDGTNTSAGKISQSSDVITLSQAGTSSGALAFATGGGALGTERMRIDGSGNVGIGTSSPGSFDSQANNLVVGIGSGDNGITIFTGGASGVFGSIFFADGSVGDAAKRGQIRYEQNNEVMSFYTNASERMRIDSSGNVGIGTTNPATKLHLAASGDPELRIEATGSAASDDARLVLKTTNGDFVIQNDRSLGSSGALTFAGNTSNNIVIDHDTGNVGIGTTSVTSGSKLHVKNASSGGTPNSQYADLTVENSAAAGVSVLSGASSLGGFIFGDSGSGDVGGIFYDHSSNAMIHKVNGGEKARIDSSGRLLVGTTSARANFFNTSVTSAFQVEGTSTPTKTVSITSSGSGATSLARLILAHQRSGSIGGNTAVGNGDAIGGISFQGSDGSEFIACADIAAKIDGTPGANDMPGRLEFSTTADGAISPTERLRIDSSGRVGIGTTSPSTLFHVNGSGDQYITVTSSNTQGTGIQFGNNTDPDAGGIIYGTGDNSFRIRTNGAEKMRLTSNGRLGLGTSAPSAPLHVSQNESQIALFQRPSGACNVTVKSAASTTLKLDGTDSVLAFVNAGGATPAYTIGRDNTDNTFRISQNSSAPGTNDLVTINSSGNVGIGTTSPIYKLVASNSGAEGIEFAPGYASNLNFINHYNRSTSQYSDIGTDAANHRFYISGTERARIDSSGRLLVGTSSAVNTQWAPNLQVVGSDTPCSFVLARNDVTVSADLTIAAIRVFGNDSNGTYEECARISAESDGDHGTGDKPTRLVFSTTADSASSVTERMRITSTGQMRLAGAGITFNGDTATANELDDYEEGTFTPTLQGLSVAGSLTYLRNAGRYTKIGNIVHITVDIKINTISVTPTGGLVFASLPFTSANVEGNFTYPGAMRLNGVSLPTGSLGAYAIALNNSTIARIQTLIDNATPGSIDGSNIAANDELQWSCTYRTA